MYALLGAKALPSSSSFIRAGHVYSTGKLTTTPTRFSLANHYTSPGRPITSSGYLTQLSLIRTYATAKKETTTATKRTKKAKEDDSPIPATPKASTRAKKTKTAATDDTIEATAKKTPKKTASTTKAKKTAASPAEPKSRAKTPAKADSEPKPSPKSTTKKSKSVEPSDEKPKATTKRASAAAKATASTAKPALKRSASAPKLSPAKSSETTSAKKTSSTKKEKAVEEVLPEPSPRPRGRPKRTASEPDIAPTPRATVSRKKASSTDESPIDSQEAAVKPTRAKRASAASKSTPPEEETSTPKKRGRSKSLPPAIEPEAPKKRGRKPSVETEAIVEPIAVVEKPAKVRTAKAAKQPSFSALDSKVAGMETTFSSGAVPELPGPDEEFVITNQLIKMISEDMEREEWNVKNTLRLLLEGNTVPFITRYRKEMIGEMDETHVRLIHKTALQYTALQERKVTVLETMRTKWAEKLTPELEREIMSTMSLRHLEDLYAPYKPKKNSLADVAISRGLLPVAENLLQHLHTDNELIAALTSHIDASRGLNSLQEVLFGVQHIWAEQASDSVTIRDAVRPIYAEFGSIAVTESTSKQSTEPAPPKPTRGKHNKEEANKEIPSRKRADTYAYYFNFNKPLSALKSHNVMAINRGEKEKFLKVKFFVPEPEVLSTMAQAFAKDFPTLEKFLTPVTTSFTMTTNEAPAIRSETDSTRSEDILPNPLEALMKGQSKPITTNLDEEVDAELATLGEGQAATSSTAGDNGDDDDGATSTLMNISKITTAGEHSLHCTLMRDAILDGFKRLLHPSLVKEARNTITESAENDSIATFGNNLRSLLLKPPVSGHTILGLDPGFAHGCKTCIIDENGKVLHTRVIFPFVGQSRIMEKLREFDQLIRKFGVTLVAIGNGTAHKHAMDFVKLYKKQANQDLLWCIVDESGASVYSVSPEAQAEFPNLDPAGRGAASIARRTLDPMAEIVKIPTQSIGVGSYQHDVNQKELERSLSSVVEDCVNYVGVNLNTASPSLLRRVSGLSNTQAQSIVKYRDVNGGFVSRTQLMDVKGVGPKTYTQCAGFLRIPESSEPLDNTNIHPESYPQVTALLKSLKFTTKDIINPDKNKKLHSALDQLSIEKTAEELGLGVPTLTDIVSDLRKPGRDPRATAEIVQLDNQISSFEELKTGQTLLGRVVNVTGFGAFVDVGIEHSGLVLPKDLIDPVTNLPVQSISLAVSPGYVGQFEVLNVDAPRKRFNMRLYLTDTQKLM